MKVYSFVLPIQWTAGRVVEGVRLERVYRATYLGFESLAVRHFSILKQSFTHLIPYSKINISINTH